MSEWISIEERLPELGKRVLVSCYNPGPKIKHFTVGIYYLCIQDPEGKSFTFHSGTSPEEGFTHFVSHWMELPELPSIPPERDGRKELTKEDRQWIKNRTCPLRNSHKFLDDMRLYGDKTIEPSYEDPESHWYGKKNY